MYQNKSHVVTFEPGRLAVGRLAQIGEALIEQGVPRVHTIYLQAPAMPDFEVGSWDTLACGPADLALATSALITW
jgi:hypothetical protein